MSFFSNENFFKEDFTDNNNLRVYFETCAILDLMDKNENLSVKLFRMKLQFLYLSNYLYLFYHLCLLIFFNVLVNLELSFNVEKENFTVLSIF